MNMELYDKNGIHLALPRLKAKALSGYAQPNCSH